MEKNIINTQGIVTDVVRYSRGIIITISNKKKIFIKRNEIPQIFKLPEDIIHSRIEALTYLAGFYVRVTGKVENWYGGAFKSYIIPDRIEVENSFYDTIKEILEQELLEKEAHEDDYLSDPFSTKDLKRKKRPKKTNYSIPTEILNRVRRLFPFGDNELKKVIAIPGKVFEYVKSNGDFKFTQAVSVYRILSNSVYLPGSASKAAALWLLDEVYKSRGLLSITLNELLTQTASCFVYFNENDISTILSTLSENFYIAYIPKTNKEQENTEKEINKDLIVIPYSELKSFRRSYNVKENFTAQHREEVLKFLTSKLPPKGKKEETSNVYITSDINYKILKRAIYEICKRLSLKYRDEYLIQALFKDGIAIEKTVIENFYATNFDEKLLLEELKERNIYVILGEGGSGKSTLVKKTLNLIKAEEKELCCFTTLTKTATTFHAGEFTLRKLLNLSSNSPYRYVFIDEATTCDLKTLYILLHKMPETKFVFVGDINQNPPPQGFDIFSKVVFPLALRAGALTIFRTQYRRQKLTKTYIIPYAHDKEVPGMIMAILKVLTKNFTCKEKLYETLILTPYHDIPFTGTKYLNTHIKRTISRKLNIKNKEFRDSSGARAEVMSETVDEICPGDIVIAEQDISGEAYIPRGSLLLVERIENKDGEKIAYVREMTTHVSSRCSTSILYPAYVLEYYRSEGLERENVIVIVPGGKATENIETFKRKFYTAITRARCLNFILINKNILKKLINEGILNEYFDIEIREKNLINLDLQSLNNIKKDDHDQVYSINQIKAEITDLTTVLCKIISQPEETWRKINNLI